MFMSSSILLIIHSIYLLKCLLTSYHRANFELCASNSTVNKTNKVTKKQIEQFQGMISAIEDINRAILQHYQEAERYALDKKVI